MAQLVVARPLGEADLGDEVGPDPVRRFARLDRVGERRVLHFPRLEQLRNARELLLIEPGAGVADVLQPPAFLHAEQQRPEVLPRLARLGPAADDELLFLLQLDLPPGGRAAPRLVGGRRVLGDQPFPASHAPRDRAAPVASAGDLFAETAMRLARSPSALRRKLDRTLLSSRLRRSVSGSFQRSSLPDAQHVERDERRGLRLFRALDVLARPTGASVPAAAGSRPAGPLVQRDDLAVEDDRRLQPLEGLPRARPRRRETGVVFSFPLRDQILRRPFLGPTSTSARMPSYFGS